MDQNNATMDSIHVDFSANSFNMSLSFLSGEGDELDCFYRNSDTSKEKELTKMYNTPMNEKTLQELIQEKQYDRNLYDYLVLQLKKMDDSNIYSNIKFKEKASHSEFASRIMDSYQNDYFKIVAFIEKILDKLLDNFHFLPYSIKCICKI